MNQYECKIIIDGRYGVGKTSLSNCMMNDETLRTGAQATIQAAFSSKKCSVGDFAFINLNLWDQAGTFAKMI